MSNQVYAWLNSFSFSLCVCAGIFVRAPHHQELGDLPYNRKRRHDREEREKAWDAYFSQHTEGFNNPFLLNARVVSDRHHLKERAAFLANQGPLPPVKPFVEEVLRRLAKYVMLHNIDLYHTSKIQDIYQCGWLHPRELKQAIEVYGISITVSFCPCFLLSYDGGIWIVRCLTHGLTVCLFSNVWFADAVPRNRHVRLML